MLPKTRLAVLSNVAAGFAVIGAIMLARSPQVCAQVLPWMLSTICLATENFIRRRAAP